MAIVWCALVVVQAAVPGCTGSALSFAGAWLLLAACGSRARCRCATRAEARLDRGRVGARATRRERSLRALCRTITRAGAFALAGMGLQPWLGLAAVRLFELTSARPIALSPRQEICAWDVGAMLVLAPCFEERLYRALLLPAFRDRVGPPMAIIASAACFALPHAEPLRMLGTWLAGIALGTLWHATGRLDACIALHAGFNGAALWQQAAARAS